LTVDEALAAAWTHCAPSRDKSIPFPRGFWPDVARVAVEMIVQDTTEPNLSFTPTKCRRGGFEAPKTKDKKKIAESILNDLEGLF
jgi:hypothetical protein